MFLLLMYDCMLLCLYVCKPIKYKLVYVYLFFQRQSSECSFIMLKLSYGFLCFIFNAFDKKFKSISCNRIDADICGSRTNELIACPTNVSYETQNTTFSTSNLLDSNTCTDRRCSDMHALSLHNSGGQSPACTIKKENIDFCFLVTTTFFCFEAHGASVSPVRA